MTKPFEDRKDISGCLHCFWPICACKSSESVAVPCICCQDCSTCTRRQWHWYAWHASSVSSQWMWAFARQQTPACHCVPLGTNLGLPHLQRHFNQETQHCESQSQPQNITSHLEKEVSPLRSGTLHYVCCFVFKTRVLFSPFFLSLLRLETLHYMCSCFTPVTM